MIGKERELESSVVYAKKYLVVGLRKQMVSGTVSSMKAMQESKT